MQTPKAKPVEDTEARVVREGLVMKQTLKNGKPKGWKVGNQYASECLAQSSNDAARFCGPQLIPRLHSNAIWSLKWAKV